MGPVSTVSLPKNQSETKEDPSGSSVLSNLFSPFPEYQQAQISQTVNLASEK